MPHFPDELVEQILANIESDDEDDVYGFDNLATYVSLSYVSKQWNRVVEPYLYRHLHTGPKGKSAGKLLRTIDDRRHLGCYTRSLVATGSTLTDYLEFPFRNRRTPLHMLTKTQSRKYYKQSFSNIIRYLPNIEALDVTLPMQKPKANTVPPWLAIMTNPDPKVRFRTLKRLDAELQAISFVELSPVFQLPVMETLNFSGGDLDPQHFHGGWEFQNPKIKHLSFRNAHPCDRIHSLGYLGQVLPNLVSLTFIGHADCGFGANAYQALIMDFWTAVSNPEFRCLRMWDERTTPCDKWISQSLVNVVRFFALHSPVEELEVDQSVIQPLWDTTTRSVGLPKYLRHLHIRSSDAPTKFVISPFLKAMLILEDDVSAGLIENLESIVAELQPQDRLQDGVLQELIWSFENAGVALTFLKKVNCKLTLGTIKDRVLSWFY